MLHRSRGHNSRTLHKSFLLLENSLTQHSFFMIIVFDLDDTLYPEVTFVYSGFRSVARYLKPLLGLTEEEIFLGLQQEFLIQRASVFDRFLDKFGIKNQRLVAKCISVYRLHDAEISLYPEADACLDRFRDFPLYVVTDGNKIVQKRKFLALGLSSRTKKCICTYQYGIHRSKPSPFCFERICQLEKVQPEQVVYVADNPTKDFVGIRPLGFRTIRVLTGAHRDIKVEKSHEAELQIDHLGQLDQALIILIEKRN